MLKPNYVRNYYYKKGISYEDFINNDFQSRGTLIPDYVESYFNKVVILNDICVINKSK